VLEKLKHYKIDPVAFEISKAILNDPSARANKDIISTAGLTRRRVEQRFLASTGLSIGLFTRKVRFQKAVDVLRMRPHLSLTQVGLEVGYYDQSHFIHEFRSFSGLSPKLFVMQDSEVKKNVSGLMMVSI
jgi:AraC-like DNA-binding protein